MTSYESILSAASQLPVADRLRLIDDLASSVPENRQRGRTTIPLRRHARGTMHRCTPYGPRQRSRRASGYLSSWRGDDDTEAVFSHGRSSPATHLGSDLRFVGQQYDQVFTDGFSIALQRCQRWIRVLIVLQSR